MDTQQSFNKHTSEHKTYTEQRTDIERIQLSGRKSKNVNLKLVIFIARRIEQRWKAWWACTGDRVSVWKWDIYGKTTKHLFIYFP